jgi:transglutaminase-like putative cysteine protease
MVFEITHTMTFTYGLPVFLEPLVVRLRPRSDCTQVLLNHAVAVSPAPAGGCQNVDLDGNGVHAFWFEGTHASLEIAAVSRVETLRINPFDFLLTDANASILPLTYPPEMEPWLRPYCKRAGIESDVDAFARGLQRNAGGATLPFLSKAVEQISALGEHVVREEGDPMPPAQTLSSPKAACRDLAVLAMDVCRSVGLASRFVSGYQQCDADEPSPHLHAWLEVYLPGAGWRGYDPTNGIAVADAHVALCAAAAPRLAAPTFGTFRGTGATSHLEYAVSITTRLRES